MGINFTDEEDMLVGFLDFDGVLNSGQSAHFWNKHRNNPILKDLYVDGPDFCPIAISNLEDLLTRVPELKIVISSAWRLGETAQSIKDKYFAKFPIISERIIDVTASFSNTRGDEIEKWLKDHPNVTNYVIMDDDNDMLYCQRNNFVHTSALHGFLYGDMLQALRILGQGGNRG